MDSFGITSDELFWNFLFANAFGYVGSHFAAGQYVMGSFFCLAFFTSYVNQAAYATRFNDTDLLHRIFWVIFSLGIAGMVTNTGTDATLPPSTFASFAGFCAWPKFCLCVMYGRVAWCLPAVRAFAISKVIDLGTHACIWLAVSAIVLNTGSYGSFERLLLIPMLVDMLSIVPFSLVLLKIQAPVPISMECTSAKFNGLNGMMVVMCAAKVISCMHDWTEISTSCYFIGFAAIMFVVLVNGKLAQVSVMVPSEVHALRKSMHTSWIWFLMQFFWVVSAMLTGVGLVRILKTCPSDAAHLQGGEMQASVGASGMFAVLCVFDTIHDAPWLSPHCTTLLKAIGCTRGCRVMAHVFCMILSSVVWWAPTFYVAPLLLAIVAVALLISLAGSAFDRTQRAQGVEADNRLELIPQPVQNTGFA